MKNVYKNKSSKIVLKEQLTVYAEQHDLDFRGSDTQYSTHGMHTYVAAMVPQLASSLVQDYVPIGQTILDPFCGGGAVLVEAVRNNRKALGSDINPLALLIARVKATYINEKTLREAAQYVLESSRRGLNGTAKFPKNYNVEYWFFPQTIAELSALQKVIFYCDNNNTFSKKIIDSIKVIFSATVRDVMLTYRNEVRLRRLDEEDIIKFKPNAFSSFENRAKIAIERISSLPKDAKVSTYEMPVQNLNFADKSFHSIVCSPPYGDERNGVSYLQFSKLMLYWLGFEKETLNQSRKLTLGSPKNLDFEFESPTLDRAFQSINQISGSRKGLEFYQDYFLGLQQMNRVTNEHIIIVIGNRILKSVLIDNALVTTELMSSLGSKLLKHYKRNLPSKRLPKLRRDEKHGFGGAIDQEDILVFKAN